jgi:hypothetical protein
MSIIWHETSMPHVDPGRDFSDVWRGPTRRWLVLSLGAALLAVMGNVGALLSVGRTYGVGYPSLTDQAIAQDIVSLAIVVPLLVLTALHAELGSLRGYLVWLGLLLFTAYNYVIYTLSIHFGPFFLVWVGVLGLTIYTLIGGFAALSPIAVLARVQRPSMRLVGWFMIAVATMFALVWLAQIVPAQIAGTMPAAATDIGTPTNPVHVLDLAIFLPGVGIAGVLLLRRQALGYVLGPPLLVFLALTAAPILITPLVAQTRGDAVSWTVVTPIGVIAAAAIWALTRLLRAIRSR